MSSSNNKRIAKNTLFLYIRQLFTMAVSLYTVRVVLDVLGAEDYGIYNVTGSIVVMFSFLSNTMATATQRFLSFELGKKDDLALKNVFAQSLYSYIIIIVFTLLISETIGLWFLNNKLIIPQGRLFAANIMYQFAILSFIVTIFSCPYNAAIIAKEKMSIFAYAGILQSSLNLLTALLLGWFPFQDSLISFAIFLFLCSLIISWFYIHYCLRKFNFCQINRITFDKSLIRSMTSFAFWNMLGGFSTLLKNQGVNMLINMFFNPAVNAARGIAMQINSAITSFSYNFYTAVRPQLIKYYSSGENKKMLKLGYQSSKLSFLLLFVITVPFFCEINGILNLWLKDTPDSTVLFAKIILITSLIEILTVPLDHMMQASGKIRIVQIVVSMINILNIPLSYVLLKMGYGPEFTMYLCFILVLISIIPRLIICKRIISLNILIYTKEVLSRVIIVLGLFFVWSYYVNSCIICHNLFIMIIIHLLFAGFTALIFGLSTSERVMLLGNIRSKITTYLNRS